MSDSFVAQEKPCEGQQLAPSIEATTHPFKGRTFQVVNDFTIEEQTVVYQLARQLKEAIAKKDDATIQKFKLNNSDIASYLIFMEDSTRTRESFRNAAAFHGSKVNVFDASTSSFKKKETITDTIKMLCGYSIDQSVFVIRSKLEGTCRWLEDVFQSYCEAQNIPRASFINAGDGRHEHPSQEMLDEFSFLEHKNWDMSSIRLALIGDLFHGRTVHSKADGLKIYKKVTVDLVAPEELQMPSEYYNKMVDAGFTVNKFESIEEYLAQPTENVATLWYFTRLQLERMGDRVLDKAPELRKAVTFRKEFVERLPENARFFHPLPRNSHEATIPFWLDNTPMNAWDRQSQNGFYTRIILLGLLGGSLGGPGQLGSELLVGHTRKPSGPTTPAVLPAEFKNDDFVEDLRIDTPKSHVVTSSSIGIKPIVDGLVVDHIGLGAPASQIWSQITKICTVLSWESVGAHGVYHSAKGSGPIKGIISMPNFAVETLHRKELKKLAAVAPGCTLNVVRETRVVQKYRLHMPPRIYNFPNISCKNEMCISHPQNMQREVIPYFLRQGAGFELDDLSNPSRYFVCKYCEKSHHFDEIWNY